MVRAKVAALRFRQGVESQAEAAQRLGGVAVAHLRAGEPRLVFVGGLPGSGKSTLAGKLADQLHGVVLRSDRIRKENEQLAPEASAAAEWLGGIYRPQITSESYGTLLDRSRDLLSLGETVILDASWQDEQWRREARRVASDRSSLITELRCDVAPAAAVDRLRRRAGTTDPSDADADTADRMARFFAAWPGAAVIDTGVKPEQAAEQSMTVITR